VAEQARVAFFVSGGFHAVERLRAIPSFRHRPSERPETQGAPLISWGFGGLWALAVVYN
jgi:hypothetical protein